MNDRFEELMQDAARTYRKPPVPDFDAMWQSIEAAMDGPNVIASIGADVTDDERPSPGARRAAHARITQRLAIAATLALLRSKRIRYSLIRAPRPFSTWQVFFEDPNGVEVEIDFDPQESVPQHLKDGHAAGT